VALPSLAGGVAVTFLWVAGHYVTTGPYFRLRDAEIHGLHRLTNGEVLETAGLGLKTTSTLGLDSEEVRKTLQAHPWIAEAEVQLWLPDRLVIRITERVPEAVVIGAPVKPGGPNGPRMLTDAYGRRFARPQRPSDVDLPAITGVDRAASQDPATLPASKRLKLALSALREWRRQGLDALDDLSEVHIDPILGLTLYTQRDGSAIRVGRTDLPLRLARVRAVLSDIHARGERAEYVLADDSRDGARLVVRTTPRRPEGAHAEASSPTDAPHETTRRGYGTKG
jgi:cell division protein FtsQ